jgi:hypothetical protein
MGTWLDSDQLFHKYGPDKALPTKGGEYVTTGALREIEFKIDLTTLTETETPLSDVVFFPKMRIEDIEIVTHTVAATGVAIDIGLVRTDRTTEIDFDGLLAAYPVAQMSTAGEKVSLRQEVTTPVSMVGRGALVGTTTTNPGYVTCSRTTATAFTAGVIFVRIRYYAF